MNRPVLKMEIRQRFQLTIDRINEGQCTSVITLLLLSHKIFVFMRE
jgi:hypothetical protein